MPDYFIVTITNASGGFEADLEIPSFIKFAKLKGKLLEILKIMDGREFGGWRDYSLSHKNRPLAAGDTLGDAGAFDGSRLVVARIA
jgi:hypothetical protein